jgi:hypothetical protein
VSITGTKDLAKMSLDNMSSLAPSSLKRTLEQFVATPNELPFDKLKNLRSDLGGLIDTYSGPGANKAAGGVVKQLYGQLSEDMDKWGLNNANSKVSEAYKAASTYWKGYQDTFGNPTIKKALNNDVNMFNMIKQLSTTKNPGKIEQVQQALGNNQGVLRGYIISDALDRSSSIVDGETLVDPGKFAGLLRSHPDAVFGDHLDKIESFSNMLNALKSTTGQPESHLITGGFAAMATEHVLPGVGPAIVPLGIMQRIINKNPNIFAGLKGVTTGNNEGILEAVGAMKSISKLLKPSLIAGAAQGISPTSSLSQALPPQQ